MAIMQSDPRQPGGIYRSHYWGNTYTVLRVETFPDWRGRSILVRDTQTGRTHWHGTAWDKRDTVISQPTATNAR